MTTIDLKHIDTIERVLDKSIRLPGGFTIGLDGIIGLIPVVGDVATTGISSVMILTALKHKVPYSVIAMMVVNILIDLLVGMIPLVGDLFDFVFRANVKNAALIRAYAKSPDTIKKNSRIKLLGVVLFVILLCILLCWLAIWLAAALLGLLF